VAANLGLTDAGTGARMVVLRLEASATSGGDGGKTISPTTDTDVHRATFPPPFPASAILCFPLPSPARAVHVLLYFTYAGGAFFFVITSKGRGEVKPDAPHTFFLDHLSDPHHRNYGMLITVLPLVLNHLAHSIRRPSRDEGDSTEREGGGGGSKINMLTSSLFPSVSFTFQPNIHTMAPHRPRWAARVIPIAPVPSFATTR
jgi:hypothetical protein